MPVDPNDFEAVLELLEDKVVRTSRGSFIAVEDLRILVKETAELRAGEQVAMPRHKTMYEAREAALRDEELRKMFKDPGPPPTEVKPLGVIKERTAQTATSA